MREDKELAVQLAEIARRTAVIGVLRAHPSTSLAELQEAVQHGPLAETLRSIHRYRLATDESCCALEARPPQPACA